LGAEKEDTGGNGGRPRPPPGFHRYAPVSFQQLSTRCGLESLYTARVIMNLTNKLRRFLTSEDGPTAVEYAVMLALIIVVCLTAITAVGTQAAAQFNNIATQVGGAGAAAS
jgi:pilus assembly protein Flp/PilA